MPCSKLETLFALSSSSSRFVWSVDNVVVDRQEHTKHKGSPRFAVSLLKTSAIIPRDTLEDKERIGGRFTAVHSTKLVTGTVPMEKYCNTLGQHTTTANHSMGFRQFFVSHS